jgi:hypothetical protein
MIPWDELNEFLNIDYCQLHINFMCYEKGRDLNVEPLCLKDQKVVSSSCKRATNRDLIYHAKMRRFAVKKNCGAIKAVTLKFY